MKSRGKPTWERRLHDDFPLPVQQLARLEITSKDAIISGTNKKKKKKKNQENQKKQLCMRPTIAAKTLFGVGTFVVRTERFFCKVWVWLGACSGCRKEF
jgi:hypothetical protein